MPTQLKTKVNTTNTQKESKQQKLLSSSIKNLRENLTDLSLDEFLRNTLETVMGIERQEYFANLLDSIKRNVFLKKKQLQKFKDMNQGITSDLISGHKRVNV